MPSRFKNDWAKPYFDSEGYAVDINTKKRFGWRCFKPDNLILGDKCDIGHESLIQATYYVEIGEQCECGPFVYLCSWDTISSKKGKVTLGPGARVGAHSVVLPGITIGKNSIVGANSVVTKDIPPNQVWVGSPARFKRNLKKDEMRVE